MKFKYPLLLSILFFVSSCSDEELESRVANLENLVSVSISQQIDAIKKSVSSLENANQQVAEHISSLEGDINNLEGDVKDLQSSNNKFGKDIESLHKLIDDNTNTSLKI